MDDLTGRTLGKYRLDDRLGAGGMASVYRAFQPGPNRQVAVKVLPRADSADPSFSERFRREVEVIASLDHPSIVPVYDSGEDDGYHYMVMPILEGGSLGHRLRAGTPLPLHELASVVDQVAAALDHAHARGIVHRDLKPANVLLDGQGRLRLSDFGIARILDPGTTTLTQTGGVIGTPLYMAPEQALGQRVDHRADVYALGVLAFQLATGRVPYRADTPVAVGLLHVNAPIPDGTELNPELPPGAAAAISQALAKAPDERFQSAGALARAIREGGGLGPGTTVAATTPPAASLAVQETLAAPAPASASASTLPLPAPESLPAGPEDRPDPGRNRRRAALLFSVPFLALVLVSTHPFTAAMWGLFFIGLVAAPFLGLGWYLTNRRSRLPRWLGAPLYWTGIALLILSGIDGIQKGPVPAGPAPAAEEPVGLDAPSPEPESGEAPVGTEPSPADSQSGS